jgi:hypothetical protein
MTSGKKMLKWADEWSGKEPELTFSQLDSANSEAEHCPKAHEGHQQ